MNSREKILSQVKANQPEAISLPELRWNGIDNKLELFTKTLQGIGGSVNTLANSEAIQQSILDTYGTSKLIVNYSHLLKWDSNYEGATYAPESMEKIDVAIIEGKLAVAENGAIWIDGDKTGHRAIPFICQHLIIVIREGTIVSNMHEAYERIDVAAHGFGVFIAGPSKTADIEQSLVIGAHGARSLVVYIVKD